MIKAKLSCPHEQVFIYNNLMDLPVLPGKNQRPDARTSEIEVRIVQVLGEQALVVLPSILAREGEIALVDTQYLN